MTTQEAKELMLSKYRIAADEMDLQCMCPEFGAARRIMEYTVLIERSWPGAYEQFAGSTQEQQIESALDELHSVIIHMEEYIRGCDKDEIMASAKEELTNSY